MTNRHFGRGKILAAAAILAGAVLSSCDSLIFDGEGDCTSRYYATFRYDANTLLSDAFGRQVTGVSLYVFDSSGNLAGTYHQSRKATADNDFRLPLDLPAGTYDMLAWCTGTPVGTDPVAFAIDNSAEPASLSALSATLPLQSAPDGSLVSGHDIVPLFHGISTGVVLPEKAGDIIVDPIYLTKDTHYINVSLVNTGGQAIDPSTFVFSLEAANSRMNYLNDVEAGSPEFAYRPWAIKQIEATTAGARAEATATGVLARMTTGRFIEGADHRLTVRRSDTGETVISMPVMQGLLQIMDFYPDMTSAQQFLDCMDVFSFELFMDENGNWDKAKILINGWRIVPPQTGGV